MSLYSRANPLTFPLRLSLFHLSPPTWGTGLRNLSLSLCFIHFPIALSLSGCTINFHDRITREAHLQCNRVRVQSDVHWIWVDVIPGWPGHSFTHLSRLWIIFRRAVRHCFSISRRLTLIAFSAKLIRILLYRHNIFFVGKT